jgi:ADP-heptose:LPS heptosyltransferase
MKILISRTDAIGDMLLTMPMAKMLKERFPESQIVVLASPRSTPLLVRHPYIDDYWTYDPALSLAKRLFLIARKLHQFRPDHYFFVGGTHWPSLLAWLWRVPFRGGLKSRWASFLYLNKGIRQSRSLVTMHESEYNLNLLSPLEIKYDYRERGNYAPAVKVTEEEKAEALTALTQELEEKKLPTNRQMVFIHPGMSGHTLNWPARNYGRLIAALEQRYPERFLFVLSHTPSDAPYLEGVRDFLISEEVQGKVSVFEFNGQLRGLRFYLASLANAFAFIGPSTGTTHMANALGIPQIGLYSPIKVQSALRWAPYNRGPRAQVMVPDVVCGELKKCAGSSCPYYECMGKMEVDDVARAFDRLVEASAQTENL